MDEDDDSNHSNDEDEPKNEVETPVEKAAEKVGQAPMNSNTDFLATNSGDKNIQLNYPLVITQFVCPVCL